MSVNPSSDPPPVYGADDVEKNNPPPSYDSIYGKIMQAKETSKGNVDFGMKCCSILCGSSYIGHMLLYMESKLSQKCIGLPLSFACSICLGFFLGLPISMIVIGAIYLDDCPAQRLIPIFLVVNGVFSIVSLLINMIKNCTKKKKDDDDFGDDEEKKKGNPIVTCIDSLLNIFLFAWFICGNVWVYGLDWVRDPVTAGNYCHPTLYYYAFWVITTTYIIMGVFLLVAIIGCIACCICVCKAAAKSEE